MNNCLIPKNYLNWMNLQNQGQQLQQSANASFMLAGTLALTTVVMSLFTDWNGYSGGE